MTRPRASGPVTTVTFCGYRGTGRLWAFNQMGSSRRRLAREHDLLFWRLLGTGHGRGFSLRPDFSRYGLLAVWPTEAAADRFMRHSSLMQEYRDRSSETWTVWLRAYHSRGSWGGVSPFDAIAATPGDRPVAVLTRAAIRPTRLVPFWRAVPATTEALDRAAGLLASVGTGDLPFVRPATFSLWRCEADAARYAYATSQHREVIARRAAEHWYSEELFARFVPLRSEGTWGGRDPLEGLVT